MKNKAIAFWILALCCLTACSKVDYARSGSETIRLGYLLNMTHAAAIVGLESQKFSNIESQYFLSGGYLVNSLLTANIDLAYIGPGPYINAINKGVDLVVLAVAATGANSICIKKDLDLVQRRLAAQKNSKTKAVRVAIPQYGNTQDLIARIVFEKELKVPAEFIPVSPPEIETAFFSNNIDAAIVTEPWGTVLAEKEDLLVSNKFMNYKSEVVDLNKYPATLLVAHRDFIEKNPELIKAFLKQHFASMEQIQKDPKASLKLIHDHYQEKIQKDFDEEFLLKSFEKVSFSNEIKHKLIKELAEESFRAKYCKQLLDLKPHYLLQKN